MQTQEPVFVHLLERDGLPDIEFYNILEDSKDFIWLAADKGLFRYDGKEFKSYSNSNKRGLSVFEPFEDHLGRIWCNNISGQFFYVENDELITFIDLGNILKGELANFVVTDTQLLVVTLTNIYTVDIINKSISKKNKNSLSFGTPLIYNDNLILGTNTHISLLKNNDSLKNIIEHKLPIRSLSGEKIVDGRTRIFKLETNFFLTQKRYNKNTFFQFDLKNKTFQKILGLEDIANRNIVSFFENKDEVWFATDKGVWVYQFIKGKFQLKRQFLKNEFVTKTIKDKDENYWITTLVNGVFIIPNINIENLSISEENKNISCLEKINDSTLLFGTNNGNVGFYDIKTHAETIIDIPKFSRVSALIYYPEEQINFVSKDVTSFLYNTALQKVSQNDNFITVKNFSIIGKDSILYVSNNDVGILNEKGDISTNISNGKRGYTSYYDDTQKETYIAYVDDLVYYDNNWKARGIRNKNQPILAISIDETDDETIWVATFKEGIFGIQKNKVIHHYTFENGLASNQVEKIKADGNDLWIATDNGIQQLNTINKTFKTLTKSDGIVSYAITGIEILKNQVVFSSNKGLFSVEKEKSFKQQSNPKIYFTGIEINEKEEEIKDHYNLSYDQNAIKFNFNVNGFQYNQKETYQYRLLGFNNDWLTTDTGMGTVKYNSLPAGKYTFQVRPSTMVSSKQNSIETITISIKNPFWKTGWFIVGSILLLGSFTVIYYRNKIKEKEKERQLQVKQLSLDNELISLKLENLRSQMNPHFIFNALNSIQEYIVLNQKKLASDYLGKFADLIRTYLNNSAKGKITLQEEIDCLEMYLELEKLRFEDKLHYTLIVSGDLNPNEVSIPTMLIQPYVENALKHGLLHRKDNRKLNVNFLFDKKLNVIICEIIDNGVGRDKAKMYKSRSHKSHNSFASRATQERLNLLNYGKEKMVGVKILDLFEDEKPTGTKVEIRIPYTIE